jgi:hypothetical protein
LACSLILPPARPIWIGILSFAREKKKKKNQVLNFLLGSWDKKRSGVGGLNLAALSLTIIR